MAEPLTTEMRLKELMDAWGHYSPTDEVVTATISTWRFQHYSAIDRFNEERGYLRWRTLLAQEVSDDRSPTDGL